MRDNALLNFGIGDRLALAIEGVFSGMTPESSENEIAECDVIMQVGHTKNLVRTTFSRRGAAVLVVRDDRGRMATGQRRDASSPFGFQERLTHRAHLQARTPRTSPDNPLTKLLHEVSVSRKHNVMETAVRVGTPVQPDRRIVSQEGGYPGTRELARGKPNDNEATLPCHHPTGDLIDCSTDRIEGNIDTMSFGDRHDVVTKAVRAGIEYKVCSQVCAMLTPCCRACGCDHLRRQRHRVARRPLPLHSMLRSQEAIRQL